MSGADISFIIICTALVFIMTPGLAFFYGGLLRKKNIINMMAMCFVSIAIVSILWFMIAYSFAFASDTGFGFIGGLDYVGLSRVGRSSSLAYSENMPHILFMSFQLMFAIITVAIVASPFSERVNFGAFCIFISIWLLIVYAPIAHWVWGDGGWLGALGALDFAGGTVVHINVGFAALAVALVIGPREGYQNEPMEPSNLPFVLLGTGFLWVGWFGFNGGSALAANGIAVLAMFNTHLAASAGALVWMLIEYAKTGKFSTLGFASGALAGLVAVTPAAGFVEPWVAVILGSFSAILCFLVLSWRAKSKIDESLDAISIHGTGGILGAILTGVFATVGAQGLILGNTMQLWIQIIGVVVTIVYAFSVTFVLAWVLNKVIKFRVPPEVEYVGMDISQHGEMA
ncbi:MAG: ammonium transporter [Candidatus Lokiarchaeota archaeon]|nr:ammonium transporter [Candidatus Lokiarchaeota archaeon]MBD3340617.1 ammonium transporter [Candidatus Lokiarchaeota archaeon]